MTVLTKSQRENQTIAVHSALSGVIELRDELVRAAGGISEVANKLVSLYETCKDEGDRKGMMECLKMIQKSILDASSEETKSRELMSKDELNRQLHADQQTALLAAAKDNPELLAELVEQVAIANAVPVDNRLESPIIDIEGDEDE